MNINRLAVFDINGTLKDSVIQHQVAFRQALESFGFKDFNTDFGSYIMIISAKAVFYIEGKKVTAGNGKSIIISSRRRI